MHYSVRVVYATVIWLVFLCHSQHFADSYHSLRITVEIHWHCNEAGQDKHILTIQFAGLQVSAFGSSIPKIGIYTEVHNHSNDKTWRLCIASEQSSFACYTFVEQEEYTYDHTYIHNRWSSRDKRTQANSNAYKIRCVKRTFHLSVWYWLFPFMVPRSKRALIAWFEITVYWTLEKHSTV